MAVVRVVVEVDYCDRCNDYNAESLVEEALENNFGHWESLSFTVKKDDGIPASERKA